MLEMVVFIVGVYTLVFGQISLPGDLKLVGWRARLASVFLLAPLPIALMLGRVVGRGVAPDAGQSFFGITELVLVVLGVGGAILTGFLTRPKS